MLKNYWKFAKFILFILIISSNTSFAENASPVALLNLENSTDYAALSVPGDPQMAEQQISKIAGVYKYRFKNGNMEGGTYMSEDIFEIVPVSKDTIYFKEKTECFNGCGCLIYGLAKYTKDNLFLFTNKDPYAETHMRVYSTEDESDIPDFYPINSILAHRKDNVTKLVFLKKGQLTEVALDENNDADIIKRLPESGNNTEDPILIAKLIAKYNLDFATIKEACLVKIFPDKNGIRIVSSGECRDYCGMRGMLDKSFTYSQLRPIRYMKILKNSREYKLSVARLN